MLSVTTGRLVSPTHISGVYDILNFMTSDDLFTHQLPRASRECKPHLLRQFPQLGSPNKEAMEAELDHILAGVDDKEKRQAAGEQWLANQVAKYGELFEVSKVPPDDHEQIDAPSELAEMVHPDKIITVRL